MSFCQKLTTVDVRVIHAWIVAWAAAAIALTERIARVLLTASTTGLRVAKPMLHPWRDNHFRTGKPSGDRKRSRIMAGFQATGGIGERWADYHAVLWAYQAGSPPGRAASWQTWTGD
jgi:hypothetical protein